MHISLLMLPPNINTTRTAAKIIHIVLSLDFMLFISKVVQLTLINTTGRDKKKTPLRRSLKNGQTKSALRTYTSLRFDWLAGKNESGQS